MENGTSDSDSTDVESLSSDDNDATNEGKIGNDRKKRGIAWCAVDDDSSVSTPKITWPPPNPSSNWRQLRPVRLGNPLYGTKMQLYSKTKQHLAIDPDGVVKGTPDDNDLHTFLELLSAGYPGHVRIKGLLTHLYVAMDKRGRLYGEVDMMNDATIFIESFQGSYNTYLSLKYAHLGWYIGMKKSGKFKRGSRTKYGQKAIMFLPRRSRYRKMGEGTDWNGDEMYLYSETGYNLTIRSNGEVLGTQDDSDLDSRLQVSTGGDVSIVRIRGMASQLYLCFDCDGNLYGEANPEVEATIFEEHFQGSYSAYRSKVYSWYVGIKKSGKPKNGNKTEWGQKAVKFLPRRRNFSS